APRHRRSDRRSVGAPGFGHGVHLADPAPRSPDPAVLSLAYLLRAPHPGEAVGGAGGAQRRGEGAHLARRGPQPDAADDLRMPFGPAAAAAVRERTRKIARADGGASCLSSRFEPSRERRGGTFDLA